MRIAVVNVSEDYTELSDYAKGLYETLVRGGHTVTLYSSCGIAVDSEFEDFPSRASVEFFGDCGELNELNFAAWLHENLASCHFDVVEAPQVRFPLLLEQIAGSTPTVVRREPSIMDQVLSGESSEVSRNMFMRLDSLRSRIWSNVMLEERTVASASRILVTDGFSVGNVPSDFQNIVDIVPPGVTTVVDREYNPEGEAYVLLEGFKDTPRIRETLTKITESLDCRVVGLGTVHSPKDWEVFSESIDFINDERPSHPEEKWLSLFSSARMLILPVDGYGFRYRMLQALSQGCPVVVFGWEGISGEWPIWRAGSVSSRESFKNLKRIENGCERMYGPDRLKFITFSKEFLWDKLRDRYEETYNRAMGLSMATKLRGW